MLLGSEMYLEDVQIGVFAEIGEGKGREPTRLGHYGNYGYTMDIYVYLQILWFYPIPYGHFLQFAIQNGHRKQWIYP